MGWLQEKYTHRYFIPEPGQRYGVDGFREFQAGSIYEPVRSILAGVDWRGKRVLEIGPGRGEALRFVLERGAASCRAYEFAPPAVAIMEATLARWADRVSITCDDALMLATEQRLFDACIMFDVIEHIPEHELVIILNEVSRVLVPGGLFLWHTPNYVNKQQQTASDLIPETAGMHCNKKDWKSLGEQLRSFGFEPTDQAHVWRKGEPVPSSTPAFIPAVIQQLRQLRPKRVLDVGVGYGKWGLLVREYLEAWDDRVFPDQWQVELTGVEAFQGYVDGLPWYGQLYDSIINQDVAELDWDALGPVDVAIAGDVLEHLDAPTALDVVAQLLGATRQALIVSIPIGKRWLNNKVVGGNPYEQHRSAWEWDEVQAWGEVLYSARDGDVGLFVFRGQHDARKAQTPVVSAAPTEPPQPTMLHVHNVQRCGGTGNFVADMAACFREYHHVALAVNDAIGDPVWRNDVAHLMRTLYSRNVSPELIEEINPRVIVLHNTTDKSLGQGAAKLDWPYAWMREGRYVIAMHHNPTWPLIPVDLDVFVSRFIEDKYRTLFPKMTARTVMPPCFDVEPFVRIGRSGSSYVDLKMTGAGKLKDGLVTDPGFAARVRGFDKPPGRFGQMPRFLANYNVVIVWSGHQESWCRTVSEAMAAGCIVIAHRSGAVPEQIRHGINGYLFDDEAGLLAAVAIVDKLQPSSRYQVAMAARAWARRSVGLDTMRGKLYPHLSRSLLQAV